MVLAHGTTATLFVVEEKDLILLGYVYSPKLAAWCHWKNVKLLALRHTRFARASYLGRFAHETISTL